MNIESEVNKGAEGHKDERQANSMENQLSKEVASWSKERRRQVSETVIESSRPVIQQRPPRPTGESKKSSAQFTLGGEAVGARPKAFSMSYDGMTQAEYTQYLLDRRSR